MGYIRNGFARTAVDGVVAVLEFRAVACVILASNGMLIDACRVGYLDILTGLSPCFVSKSVMMIFSSVAAPLPPVTETV